MSCRKGYNNNKEFYYELASLKNIEEKKMFYLKYLLNEDYFFNEDDIYNIKSINIKKKYYFNEESNDNIGETLINNFNYINNMLPTYIIFKNKKNNKCKWTRIENKIARNDLTSRNSIKLFRDKDSFLNYINHSIYEDDFQKENINITIYGDNIIHKSVYKKLTVKYDVYYINLEEYETIKTKINFFKNKQILEILGAQTILIDRKNLSSKIDSHIVGLTTYNVEESLEATQSEKNTEKNIDVYKYKLRKGFFSSVDDFLKKIDIDKYILFSREEIENDFELKSLIGARIEKSLKEFNKIIYVSKITSKELKFDLLLKQSHGLTFGRKKYNNHHNFLKIKAIFYGVEELYCLDEIPLTYEGFKILNDMSCPDEKRKYIENFYIRMLRKNNYISEHLELVEKNPDGSEGRNGEPKYYKNLLENIDSFFNIEQLLECLRGTTDVKINTEGFDILRICIINQKLDASEHKKKFLKDLLKLNFITLTDFGLFLQNKEHKTLSEFIEKKIISFKNIKKYILKYLTHVDYCSLDERGHYFIFSKTDIDIYAKKDRLLRFIARYISTNNDLTNEDNITINNYINSINNDKIELMYELDYFSFKKLLHFIFKTEYRDREIHTLDFCRSTPIRTIVTPEIIERRKSINNELLCMYKM